MALNLQGIISKERESEFLEWVNAIPLENCEVEYEDNKYVILKQLVYDKYTHEVIGKLVFSLIKENDSISLEDADFVLNNEKESMYELWLDESTPEKGNEYYLAMCHERTGAVEIEVIDRHVCQVKDLDGLDKAFYVSAFPFFVEIEESKEELNKAIGLDKPIQIDKLEELGLEGMDVIDIDGVDDYFTSPHSPFQSRYRSNEFYTYFVGKVVDYKEVTMELLNSELSFIIVNVDSAMGIIPAAMSKECFDLSNLEAGKVIEMKADIKADFCKCE